MTKSTRRLPEQSRKSRNDMLANPGNPSRLSKDGALFCTATLFSWRRFPHPEWSRAARTSGQDRSQLLVSASGSSCSCLTDKRRPPRSLCVPRSKMSMSMINHGIGQSFSLVAIGRLGPLGSSSPQHRRTPELVLKKDHASFRIPPCTHPHRACVNSSSPSTVLSPYRGFSKLRTRTALGPYCNYMPESIGPS